MPAELRENECTVALGAGQLPLAGLGCFADPLRGRYAELEAVSPHFHSQVCSFKETQYEPVT